MRPLTEGCRERVRALFSPDDRIEAERLLEEECGENLSLMDNASAATLDRVRFAALRLSAGRLDLLREAIQLGQADWRDLLLAAGFGDIHAHESWQPRALLPETIDLWMKGVRPDGVHFSIDDPVRMTGPTQTGIGAIVSLLALEPEPRYLVELSSGSAVRAYQRWLTPIS